LLWESPWLALQRAGVERSGHFLARRLAQWTWAVAGDPLVQDT